MNYGSIKLADCANGPGMRTSLFVSGCRHHCPGCFNQQTWDFDYGQTFTREVEKYVLSTLDEDYIDGLSILGGEPFEPENQEAVFRLCLKAWKTRPRKNIWIYSGFTWDELTEPCKRAEGPYIMQFFGCAQPGTVLVDGPFIETQKDISLLFRGSKNQRLIDVAASMRTGRVILWEGKT